MKKSALNYLLITALALIVVTLTSCNSKGSGELGNSSVKLLESMTTTETSGHSYTQKFEYDDKNRIVKIQDNHHSEVLIITYEGDDLGFYAAQWGGENVERQGNTIRTGRNDEKVTITLNDAGYIVKIKSENSEWKAVALTTYFYQDGNLMKTETQRTLGKEKDGWTEEFKYDGKKSPFFHCNTSKWFLHWYFITGFDNNVVECKDSDGIVKTYQYEYDSDGFPTKQTMIEKRSDGTKSTTITTFRWFC